MISHINKTCHTYECCTCDCVMLQVWTQGEEESVDGVVEVNELVIDEYDVDEEVCCSVLQCVAVCCSVL